MTDILSQEEIDRLLSGAPVAPVDEAHLSPEDLASVERVTRVLFASANSALATLLARPASVSEGACRVMAPADVEAGKAVLARLPFRSGFSGELVFVLRHADAAALADLVLGGEGVRKAALEEADLDALKEAFAQIAGSAAPTLSATLGREVGFAPPSVEEAEAGRLGAALPWSAAFLGQGTVRVDGAVEAPLRALLPLAVAEEMAGLSRGAAEPASRPTAPAPSPAARPPGRPAVAPAAGGRESPDIRNIDLIMDIEVEVLVRLGEATLALRDIQRLRPGSIVDLDKDTDAPVELVVNDRVIAKGELVVVSSDHFALRITEIESPTERIRRLGP